MKFLKKLFGNSEKRKTPTQNFVPQDANSDHGKSFNNFSENGFPTINFALTGNQALDVMSTVGRIDKVFKKNNVPLEIEGFHYTALTDNGIIRIPVVLRSENKGYSLFYIYNEDQAKAFNSSQKLLPTTKYPNSLFISQLDLENISEESNETLSLMLSDLSYDENAELKGEYAMWWSDDSEGSFYKSKSKASILNIYETIKDYESYMFGYFLSEINMKGFEQFQRVSLPQSPKTFAIKGPEYKQIVISASQEKGIRFQFPKETANKDYREIFLNQLSLALQTFREVLITKGVPKDEENDENGYDWFTFMSRVVEKQEKNGEINGDFVIGGISFD